MDDTPVVMVADRYGRAAAIAALVVALGWHLGNDLPAMLGAWSGYRLAPLVGAVWLGYLILAVVFGTAMLRGRGHGPLAAALALPAVLLGAVLTHVANGHGSVFAPPDWAWAAAGWFAVLVLWHRRLVELVAFCLVNATITLVTIIHIGQSDRIEVSRFIMVAYGVSVLPVTVFVGGRVLAGTARRAAQTQDAQARIDTARLAAEVVHQARTARFRSARQASAQLLAGLASGELDLDSPETQRQCRVAAARLRRLIAETDDVPDPLVHELRACADTAERRGVEVDLAAIGTIPALPVEIRRRLTDPPIEVLATARTKARITVVAAPDDVAVAVVADAALPSAVPAGTDPPAPGEVAASFEREGGQVWVQTRWHGR
ncbi:MAG: hypothetical protein V7603_2942 [Micromonosporaceae bacterium]